MPLRCLASQLFLTICIKLVVISGKQVKIGIICDINPESWQYLFKIASAINIATDKLKEDDVLSEDFELSVVWKDTVLQSDGVGNVVDLVLEQKVDAIFGSPSSRISLPTAHLTSHWNFPHISWAANSFELSDKTLFTTFVRSIGPLSEVGKSIVALFRSYDWHRIGLLYIDYGLCLYSAHGIKTQFPLANLTIIQSIAYPHTIVLTDNIIDDYLGMIRQTSRIILLCVSDLRRFLIRAYYAGMCNGEFVFIYTSLNKPTDELWQAGDKYDRIAKMAVKHLLYITTADWVGDDARSRLDQFNMDVIDRMVEPPWNSTYAKENNIEAGTGAQNLYDAMYMYGLWINHSETHGLNLKDGHAFLNFTKDLSFQGLSGPFDMGDNGDKVPYFWIFQFRGADMQQEIVALSETKLEKITETIGFQWYTHDGSPPFDTPVCGYFNELCPVEDNDLSLVITLSFFGVLIPVCSVCIAVYIIRKKKLDAELLQSVWKINIDEIEIQKSRAAIGSRISTRSMAVLNQSKVDCLSESGTYVSTKPDYLMATVGLFKGQLVSVRSINRQAIHSKVDLYDLKSMREMVHDNVNPFLGACFDSPSPCLIFIYCTKGSLQDVLENDEIKLDTTFKFSLTTDLVQGMLYIHNSNLKSHGRLKSSNCLVDNRWMLKITDYGIGKFVDDIGTDHVEEHQRYKSLLWTAPELLSDPRRSPKGTPVGDVYSFSIILHEIFYRMGTFAGRSSMTAKDIIGRIKNRETNPCRPEIYTDVTDVTPAIVKLMQMCWLDNESERPSFSVVRNYLKKKVYRGDSTNIVDVILNRLEKYASNLEELVEQRTQQLMAEKQKTDKLLYRMLPRSCADKLKIGETVQPEIYEAATVFFSDIVGFTTLSSKSTPIQVVDFLNDLYSCFDAIIAQYDAYKVETIGDAYLVVSGIPVRNGEKHSGIIANMSLDLREETSKFKVKHLPNEVLKVRIGMHTGPCCAGVVGLSMPRYCLFGDTVNTASRMESNGEANKIHLSEAAYLALLNIGGYDTTYRGEMPIKGKGIMSTYWLNSSSSKCCTSKGLTS